MATLSERLEACARAGALSTADLAVWLDISYSTVRSYRAGREPYPARRAQIEQRLSWLEQAIEGDPRLPIPLQVRQTQRRQYLKGVKDAYQRFI